MPSRKGGTVPVGDGSLKTRETGLKMQAVSKEALWDATIFRISAR